MTVRLLLIHMADMEFGGAMPGWNHGRIHNMIGRTPWQDATHHIWRTMTIGTIWYMENHDRMPHDTFRTMTGCTTCYLENHDRMNHIILGEPWQHTPHDTWRTMTGCTTWYLENHNRMHHMIPRENRMVDRCMRKDSSSCDPSRITRDRRLDSFCTYNGEHFCHYIFLLTWVGFLLLKVCNV